MTAAGDVPGRWLDAVARDWGVELIESAGSRYSQAWFARRGDEHVVLKRGNAEARRREAIVLRVYEDGWRRLGEDPAALPACRLLAAAEVPPATSSMSAATPVTDGAAEGTPAGNPEAALLIERIVPGDDLRPFAAVDDDGATAIAGALIARLHAAASAHVDAGGHDEWHGDPRRDQSNAGHQEPGHQEPGHQDAGLGHRPAGTEPAGSRQPTGLPPLADLLGNFSPQAQATAVAAGVPADLLARARGLCQQLSTPGIEDTVLHGDAHHSNLVREVRAGDWTPAGPGIDPGAWRWRAIDPNGWWGDPAFETAAFMLNPHDLAAFGDDPVTWARRRAAILAEHTGYPRERILAWAYVAAVICELWCLRDHGFVQGPPVRLAAALHAAGVG